MHSLAEIINFNIEHPELCLPPSTSLFALQTSILTHSSMPRPERSTRRSPVDSETRRNQHRPATPPNRRRPRRPRLPLRLPTTRHHHRPRRRPPIFHRRRSWLPHGRMPALRPQTQWPALRPDTRVAPAHRTHAPALPHRVRKPVPAARTTPAALVRAAARRASRAAPRSTYYRSHPARVGHAPL
jgi:hypothetical protein